MFSTACEIYGWDMLTSVLIHELGHVEMHKAERLWEGLEAEQKANDYGYKNMPAALIPELYWYYRDFCLRSYETPGNWTEEQFRAKLKMWRRIGKALSNDMSNQSCCRHHTNRSLYQTQNNTRTTGACARPTERRRNT